MQCNHRNKVIVWLYFYSAGKLQSSGIKKWPKTTIFKSNFYFFLLTVCSKLKFIMVILINICCDIWVCLFVSLLGWLYMCTWQFQRLLTQKSKKKLMCDFELYMTLGHFTLFFCILHYSLNYVIVYGFYKRGQWSLKRLAIISTFINGIKGRKLILFT